MSQAPTPKRTTLLSAGFVSKKHQGTLVRFGPKGCVSTWLNDQARCMIKTECAEKDVDNYNFKFICVDESGEHVRHVFGKGSFDPEETFDTLVTCTSCTADADDLMVSAKQGTGDSKTMTSDDGPKSTNAVLRQIAADVGELKAEIANATQNVERLNAAVFKKSTFPPAASTPMQAETTPAPSSLVHRGDSILRTRGKSSRLRAIKAHAQASKSHTHKIRRRHAEYDVDTADQEEVDIHNRRADRDAVFSEEDARTRNQDSSSEQDDAQDLDDARHDARRQDQHDDQEDDDAERMDQDDVNDSDLDFEEHDDEHGQHDDEHGQHDDEHGQHDEEHGQQDDEHGQQDDEHGQHDDEHGQLDDDEQHDDEHGQHDDQHDQARAGDRTDSNNGEDARDIAEDGDWHRKDNTD